MVNRAKVEDMSMMEYFAGQALAGMNISHELTMHGEKWIADRAWAVSKEMMEYYPDDEKGKVPRTPRP